jgi:hypothetical protein
MKKLIFCLFLIGCGSDGTVDTKSLPTNGTYTDKCSVVCGQKSRDGLCAGFSTDTCTQQCTAMAEGLPLLCAQCQITNGYYAANSDTSVCKGFKFDTGVCSSECASPTPDAPGGDVYLNKCKVVCPQKATTNLCAGYPVDQCVQQCATEAAGLPLLCGQCEIQNGYYTSSTDLNVCNGFKFDSGVCSSECAAPKPGAPSKDLYAQKCRIACMQKATSNACAGYSIDQCTDQCSALADGLPILCGQCQIANGYYTSSNGTCNGFKFDSGVCSEECS